jgi:DivIVA domain-containing protein
MSLSDEDPTFRTVRMREGYDTGEVDDYLDRLAGELRRREVPGDPGTAVPPSSVVQPQSSSRWVALLVVALLVVVVPALVR